MINQDQFRSIEGRLYRYEDMKSTIQAYEDAHCSHRGAPQTGLPRGQAVRSDPTARGALALAEPPPAIALSIRWVKAIDRALDRLTAQSPNVWDIARSYYIAGSELPVRRRIAQLCTHLNIERAAFNQYRRCIVHSVYLQALYEHLLTPDEAGIRELMTT